MPGFEPEVNISASVASFIKDSSSCLRIFRSSTVSAACNDFNVNRGAVQQQQQVSEGEGKCTKCENEISSGGEQVAELKSK